MVVSKKRIQYRHQPRKLLREALAVHEIRLTGHGEELGGRGGAVGVEPGPVGTEALGLDDGLPELGVSRFRGCSCSGGACGRPGADR